ncbi:glycosyltransferase [Clostridium sp. Cult3]|uniref:glycosyltransferase n=1 Tax=Clostridium sp. Cult3 TaxID=2079004 RepID=UPI001F17654D|nr:glycosyltransferase family 2 protein [Clostridium sp. Cult3]MCF6460038.1 glycosyl transferase family 2 [Clostridium sp. Cult3]
MMNPINKSIDKFLKRKKITSSILNNKGVSIITCTNLPHSLDNILDNFIRQDVDTKELLIIINNNKIDEVKWKNKTSKYDSIRVFKLNENISLGRCLNFGVEKAKYDIISKFDDDDYYGPKYLSDTIKYFDCTEAKLIGKGATFVYVVDKNILTIRNPHEENKYTNFVNGSTLTFKKGVFNMVRFQDKNIAEDVHFCRDCIRNGIKIYSCSKFHHVYFRSPSLNNHTWKIEDDEFLNLCCRQDLFNEPVESIDDIIKYVDI